MTLKVKKHRILLSILLLFLLSVSGYYYLNKQIKEPCYDVNGDGKTGMSDLISVMLKNGQTCSNCMEDLNSDRIIDAADLEILKTNMGKECR